MKFEFGANRNKIGLVAGVLAAGLALDACGGYNEFNEITSCTGEGTNVVATLDTQAQDYNPVKDPFVLNARLRETVKGSAFNPRDVGVGIMACQAANGTEVLTVHGEIISRELIGIQAQKHPKRQLINI